MLLNNFHLYKKMVDVRAEWNKGVATLQRLDKLERKLDMAFVQLLDGSYKFGKFPLDLKHHLLRIVGLMLAVLSITQRFFKNRGLRKFYYYRGNELFHEEVDYFDYFFLTLKEYRKLLLLWDGKSNIPKKLTSGVYNYLNLQDLWFEMLRVLSNSGLELMFLKLFKPRKIAKKMI